MPFLDSITFVSTHADGNAPICTGDGVWTLKTPGGTIESCIPDATTVVDLHQTVSIPVGYLGIIAPYTSNTLTGAAGCVPVSQVIVGTGAAQALKILVANPSASAQSPTSDASFATMIIVACTDFKHDVSGGTWS